MKKPHFKRQGFGYADKENTKAKPSERERERFKVR